MMISYSSLGATCEFRQINQSITCALTPSLFSSWCDHEDAADVNATEDYSFIDDHSADEEEGPEIAFDEDDFQEISTGRTAMTSINISKDCLWHHLNGNTFLRPIVIDNGIFHSISSNTDEVTDDLKIKHRVECWCLAAIGASCTSPRVLEGSMVFISRGLTWEKGEAKRILKNIWTCL